MSRIDPRERSRRIADESLVSGDPTAWFERLYAEADQGSAIVPWEGGAHHRLLEEWSAQRDLDGRGRTALVVGSGLGEDAEYIASLGFDTVAFDISATAVRVSQRRYPGSRVRYRTADLLDLPAEWERAFDLVVEAFTVQALPEPYRGQAIRNVGSLVAPGGTLVVIATGRDDVDRPVQGPPWPLVRSEIGAFPADGIEPVRIEQIPYSDRSGDFCWRAEFRRPVDTGTG